MATPYEMSKDSPDIIHLFMELDWTAICQLKRTDLQLKKNENFSLVSKVNCLRYKEIEFIWNKKSSLKVELQVSNSKKRPRFLGVKAVYIRWAIPASWAGSAHDLFPHKMFAMFIWEGRLARPACRDLGKLACNKTNRLSKSYSHVIYAKLYFSPTIIALLQASLHTLLSPLKHSHFHLSFNAFGKKVVFVRHYVF